MTTTVYNYSNAGILATTVEHSSEGSGEGGVGRRGRCRKDEMTDFITDNLQIVKFNKQGSHLLLVTRHKSTTAKRRVANGEPNPGGRYTNQKQE